MLEGVKDMNKDLVEAENSNIDESKEVKRYHIYDSINIKENHLDRFIISTIFVLGMVIVLGVIL